MVEYRRVKQTEVELWQINVDPSRVKQFSGRLMQSQVDCTGAMIQECRAMWSEVEVWLINVE